MTTGLSGTYGFNNINLSLQPTTGKWVERTSYGYDGSAHPIYSALRSFEITWDLISPTDAKQIIDFYNTVSTTGTVVSCLPEWGALEYQFKNYSGTNLNEIVVGEYFQGFITSVSLLIINIRT